MTRAQAMLYRLVNGLMASAIAVVVIAHPDDESVSLGGSMGLFLSATLIQLTDGAPADPEYRPMAFAHDREAYRATRRDERERAFAAAGWQMPVVDCGIPDQAAHAHLATLVDVLTLRLAGAQVVFTHPYEGGHPDHDAAAFAVQSACDRLTATGQRSPERVEFASYHWNGARRVHGRFWLDAQAPEVGVLLAGERLEQKRRAMAAYVSQRAMLGKFPVVEERYRVAPRYDFTQPPAPPACVYERNGWPMTNADLRAAMARCA